MHFNTAETCLYVYVHPNVQDLEHATLAYVHMDGVQYMYMHHGYL